MERKRMKPHKYAELIKAWADGATIQVKYRDDAQYWVDRDNPIWHPDNQYRIKPEPKPDVVRYAVVSGTMICQQDFHNVRAIFDGETGELKSVEMIK
jgi:hypothetical protein